MHSLSILLKSCLFVIMLNCLIVASNAYQHEHLPYGLRHRYSKEIVVNEKDARGVEGRSLLATASLTSSSSSLETNTASIADSTRSNALVTHHIDDIESFFVDQQQQQFIDEETSPLLSSSTTTVVPATNSIIKSNHRHHNHHLRNNRLHNNHHSSTIRPPSRLISQKRTVKNQQQQQQQQQQQTDYQTNSDYVTATIGKDVQLDCKIKSVKNEDEKIIWLKMPKGEILTLNSNRVTADLRVNALCNPNQMPCLSLTIANTRESDTGVYACQTNEMKSKYVYLDIMVPPKLLTQYPVDRIDVNQSSNASITCEFYGKPQPLIKWYKYHNGQQKEIEKFRGFKTIDVFIHADSPNEYECVADNSIPPVISKKIFLNVQYLPKIKFMNNRVYQKKNERVIFDCVVDANPEPKVNWYRNNERVIDSAKYSIENIDNKNYRLYINNVNEKDFGNYYCTAVNAVGETSSRIELLELPGSSSAGPQNAHQTSSSSAATATTTAATPSTMLKLNRKQTGKQLIKQATTKTLNGLDPFDDEQITVTHSSSASSSTEQQQSSSDNLRNSFKIILNNKNNQNQNNIDLNDINEFNNDDNNYLKLTNTNELNQLKNIKYEIDDTNNNNQSGGGKTNHHRNQNKMFTYTQSAATVNENASPIKQRNNGTKSRQSKMQSSRSSNRNQTMNLLNNRIEKQAAKRKNNHHQASSSSSSSNSTSSLSSSAAVSSGNLRQATNSESIINQDDELLSVLEADTANVSVTIFNKTYNNSFLILFILIFLNNIVTAKLIF